VGFLWIHLGVLGASVLATRSPCEARSASPESTRRLDKVTTTEREAAVRSCSDASLLPAEASTERQTQQKSRIVRTPYK